MKFGTIVLLLFVFVSIHSVFGAFSPCSCRKTISILQKRVEWYQRKTRQLMCIIKGKVQCPSLDSPNNGTVSISGPLVPGATATYTCDYGLVSGDLVRYCLADGTWSGTEPVCGTDLAVTIIICEHDSGTISCSGPGEVISIISANYGRTSPDPTICPHPKISDTNCGTGDESDQDLVIGVCNGQTTCELLAENSVFGDPCVGTYKYLEVSYRCITATPTTAAPTTSGPGR